MIERTLAIVKPDAMAKNAIGEIVGRAEAAQLRVVGAKLLHLRPADAARFYLVHKEQGFYRSLIAFMCEGPILAVVLEGENAIANWRDLMGPTDAAQAPAGSIRGDLGTNVERNAVHGSDSPDTARWEIAFFFGQCELAA